MRQILLRGLTAITLCSLFSGAAYYFLGLPAMILSLPLFGYGLSRVIIDLVAELRHVARGMAIGHLSGHFYSYNGTPVPVLEDESHCRWVPTAVMRTIIGSGASDGALAIAYPVGWCAMGKPAQGHLRDDALMNYLAKQGSVPAVNFKNWAERSIAFPARKQRERLGVRLSAPDAAAGKDEAT